MGTLRFQSPVHGVYWMSRLIPIFAIFLLYRVINEYYFTMRTSSRTTWMAAVAAAFARPSGAASVDLNWHAPRSSAINNLTQVIGGSGVYGFIYNSSTTPADEYGVYNWCNMPHVRATEYKKASSAYKLQYVEVVGF